MKFDELDKNEQIVRIILAIVIMIIMAVTLYLYINFTQTMMDAIKSLP